MSEHNARGGSAVEEHTIALNPLTGFHLDDLREILTTTAAQGARQPILLGKHADSHARKLVDIVVGRSNIQPDKGDPRFRDDAWLNSGVYQRLMQSYLALNESLQEWRVSY
jgi:polyhydroxyalkanoate synthase